MKFTAKNFCAILIALFSFSYLLNAQDKDIQKKANQWFKTETYLNGLTLKPFKGTNQIEFYNQYRLNKERFDKAFAFLKNTNLDTLSVGKHSIDGDDLFASVTESPTKAFEETKWEFHKKYIDIQYIIKGKEKMGILPIDKLSITNPYNESKDGGLGTTTEGEYYVAEPGTFLIFFPADAHRPSIKVEGCDKTKKIVLKIRAK